MGRTYLLDTNIISYLTDSKSPYRERVKERLFSLSEEDSVSVSIVTLYELAYGLATFEKSKEDDDDNRDEELFESGIEFIKEYLDIFPLSVEEIGIFGKIKAKYKQETGINTKALKKNDLDFLIASTAISQRLFWLVMMGYLGILLSMGLGWRLRSGCRVYFPLLTLKS
jgi:predicted nucleic acid-binding protein